MATVREATFDLFRAHGMTTIFGNPGSTELPMLADFPDDFRYVLGLQEQAVVGMADGFAQATGRPTHVNLHTAPGVGNAVGGIFNAQANKAPLVITAGQQVRPHITIEANLTNRDATIGPAAVRQVEPRAGACTGRPRRARARDQLRDAGPARAGVRVDPDGRLVAGGRRRPRRPRARSHRHRPQRSEPDRARRAGEPPRRGGEASARDRPGDRRVRRLGRGGRTRREAAAAGLGEPGDGRLAARLPRAPPQVRRHPAARDRPAQRDAQGVRPRARGRLVGVPVLPLPPGPAARARHRAGGDHQRSGRGGARPDG